MGFGLRAQPFDGPSKPNNPAAKHTGPRCSKSRLGARAQSCVVQVLIEKFFAFHVRDTREDSRCGPTIRPAVRWRQAVSGEEIRRQYCVNVGSAFLQW